MSLRIDTSELISGAYVVGETGLGVLAEDIPTIGLDGASFLYNDLSLPADNGKEVRGLIVTPPSDGVFYAWEDGSFTLTDAADGSYTFVYRLYVDGADQGTATATITVGAAASSTLSGSATLGDVSADGALAQAGASDLSGSATLGDIAASGGGSGSSASDISGDSPLGDVGAGGAMSGSVTSPGTSGQSYVVSASGRRWEVVARGHGVAESKTVVWPAKYPGERVGVMFDFRPDMAFGDAVSSVAFVVSTVHGTDVSPANLLSGSASVKGGRVFQDLHGGSIDCSYLVECEATLLKGGVLILAGVLPVKSY